MWYVHPIIKNIFIFYVRCFPETLWVFPWKLYGTIIPSWNLPCIKYSTIIYNSITIHLLWVECIWNSGKYNFDYIWIIDNFILDHPLLCVVVFPLENMFYQIISLFNRNNKKTILSEPPNFEVKQTPHLNIFKYVKILIFRL